MNFREFCVSLASWRMKQIAFFGLGNSSRGDDAAGLVLFDRLKESAALKGARFVRAEANPENHLKDILDSEAQLVVFIDAGRFGGNPGEINWVDEERIDSVGVSTHAFSLRAIAEFLRLHKPFVFKVLVVQPETAGFGTPLSPAVRRGVEAFFLQP